MFAEGKPPLTPPGCRARREKVYRVSVRHIPPTSRLGPDKSGLCHAGRVRRAPPQTLMNFTAVGAGAKKAHRRKLCLFRTQPRVGGRYPARPVFQCSFNSWSCPEREQAYPPKNSRQPRIRNFVGSTGIIRSLPRSRRWRWWHSPHLRVARPGSSGSIRVDPQRRHSNFGLVLVVTIRTSPADSVRN